MRKRKGPAPAIEMSPALLASMIDSLREGKSFAEVGRIHKTPAHFARNWLHPVAEIIRAMSGSEAAPRGSAWNNSKRATSDEQRAEIVRRLPTADSLRQIAEAMGISNETVRRTARPAIAAMREAGTLPLCECGQPRFHPRLCSRTAHPGGRDGDPVRRAAIIGAIMTGDTFASIGAKFGISSTQGVRAYLEHLTPAQRERRKALERQRRWKDESLFRPTADPLYAQIAAATPRWLSSASRDDAISETWLAITEGRASNVAEAAREYAARTVAQFESRFGPKPLDAPMFEGGRETYIDMIEDEGALAAFDDIFNEGDRDYA